jgi:hypothetical protein
VNPLNPQVEVLWVDDHFSWFIVALVVYSTFSLVAFDYCWRVIYGSFRKLALYGGVIFVLGIAAIVLTFWNL